MTTLDTLDKLCIRVLEEAPESGLFVVHVLCDDLVLLGFWWRKEPFQSELLEQTNVAMAPGPSGSLGLEFVLRVRHRVSGVGNAHYWCPFVLGLCLDALRFRFVLPPRARLRGLEEEMRVAGRLELQR